MQIQYFSTEQNLVFVPALLAVLVATVLICLPIVLAPALRSAKRLKPVAAVAGVLAAVALVGAVVVALPGFQTLGAERAAVKAALQRDYGVTITESEAGDLIDGGKVPKTLPEVAAAAGLTNPEKAKNLKLEPTTTGGDVYVVTIGGKTWPR